MNDITIQFKKGSSGNLKNIYTDCEFINPAWSWYEPKPESLLNANITGPLLTFARGIPEIPEGVSFSELMLFDNNKGLTIISTEKREYQYFHWWVEASSSLIEGAIKCKKKAVKKQLIHLHSENILKTQYGFDTEDISDLPETLEIIQYHHENKCIAWTLTG